MGPVNSSRRSEANSTFKKNSPENAKGNTYPTSYTPRYSPSPGEDRRAIEPNKGKTGEERLNTLKSYRKAKGLCFKCGEKWHPGHKCQNISLQVMEEVWEFLSGDHTEPQESVEEQDDSGDDLMAISVQAMKGIEGARTMRLRGFVDDQEVFMLVDSGSTHCFISVDIN